MNKEDLREALRESMRRYENNLFTSEYAMEVPRDTIYIKMARKMPRL